MIAVGVDTHKAAHVAAALEDLGQLLGELVIEASVDGYAQLAAWAQQLAAEPGSELVFGIEGTGSWGAGLAEHGVPRGLIDAFSSRTREVARAIERFRAEHGRAPELGELRALKLENRRAKTLTTKGDLQRAWEETAARHDFDGRSLEKADIDRAGVPDLPLEDRVEQRLTERAATFQASELRAVVLEQPVGELAPREALSITKSMLAERRVLPLQGGLMTTLSVRASEQAIERR